MADQTSEFKGKPSSKGMTTSQLLRDVVMSMTTFSSKSWDAVDKPDIRSLRSIISNPTLAIARITARVPAKVGARDMAYVSDDDEKRAFIEEATASIWPVYMNECLNYGVDYGFQGFEIIWRLDKSFGSIPRMVPDRLKPLLADITHPWIDPETGDRVGVTNKDVDIPRINSVWFTHDAEACNPFGRPRLMPCWPIVQAWNVGFKKLGHYVHKVAGIIPMVEYPVGQSLNAEGAEVSNYDIANSILGRLGSGHGVSMPNTLAKWAEDLATRGVDTKDLRAWSINFLEPNGQHGNDLTGIMNSLDKWILRAYLVPERTVIEGEHGTKAESETHTDIVISSAEEVLESLVDIWNEQVVNKLLVANYGAEAAGTVVASVPPLIDSKRASIESLVNSLIENESTLPTLLRALDIDASVSQMGLPIREGVSLNKLSDDGMFESITDTLPQEDAFKVALSRLKVSKYKRA